MLDKSKSNNSATAQAEKLAAISQQAETRPISISEDSDLQYQRQQHQPQEHNSHNLQNSIGQWDKSNILMDDQAMSGTYWFNDAGSPCFSNVDQLLSPGFSVPENIFQSFFTGYVNGMGGTCDQMIPASNNDHVGMFYNV